MSRAAFEWLAIVGEEIEDRPVRWSVVLACIPVVIFGLTIPAARSKTPPPIVPRMVATETIREVRMDREDESLFRRRWEMVEHMPPTVEVRHYPQGPVVSSVGTGKVDSPQHKAQPSRHFRSKPVKLDVCERHGLKKVFTTRGRWPSWRCRR